MTEPAEPPAKVVVRREVWLDADLDPVSITMDDQNIGTTQKEVKP